MISIYLNSLYNMVYRNNPVLMIGVDFWKNINALRNLHRNMKRAKKKMVYLEHQMQAVEAYVNYTDPSYTAKFDVTR